jgi:uncharacterized protein (DUF1015 family)
MAEVKAFRGIRFNPEKVKLDQVVAPPYDVINPQETDALYDQDPHNCIRLILNRDEDRYTSSAKFWTQWQNENVLMRDDKPTIYNYHQTFTTDAGTFTRRGFIAAVKLHPFNEGVVLPHEKTLSGPKKDRLALMKACSAQLSQVFVGYEDENGAIQGALDAQTENLCELNSEDGVSHSVGLVTDEATVAQVTKALADKQLFVIDGHHRYETAIAYRDHLIENSDVITDASAQYGMLFLTDVNDPGLQVLATHRIPHDVENYNSDEFLENLKKEFNVESTDNNAVEALATLPADRNGFVVVDPNWATPMLVTAKDNASLRGTLEGPEPVKKLDVAVLHQAILHRILGITPEMQAAKTHISYCSHLDQVADVVAKDNHHVAFYLRPTPVQAVLECARESARMPQKSTFFFPKILSGLVFNPISTSETL